MAFVRDPNNLIPIMTSNTTPLGSISAGSVYSASYDAWKAFNGTDSTPENYWASANGVTASWLRYDFTSSKIVNKYNMIGYHLDIGYSPKTWTFEGSNDGNNWTILDTRTNITSWVLGTAQSFVFSNTIPYTKYRINISSTNGATLIVIGELEMLYLDTTQTTWSASNLDANTLLSNNNSTVTFNTNAAKIVSSNSRNSGKVYFELVCTNMAWILLGIGDGAAEYRYIYGYGGNNSKYSDIAGASSYTSAFTGNYKLGVALDFSANTIIFYMNGSSLGIAYSDINLLGNTYIQAAPGGGGQTGTITLSTKASQFTYPVPSGYTAWDNETTTSISATGGTITYNSNKTVHTFTSSGTFSVNGTGTIDVLVVAGGGGGGRTGGNGLGGAGGGGVASSSLSVSSQSYSVIVGNGGAANVSGGSGANGGNSQFSSLLIANGGSGAYAAGNECSTPGGTSGNGYSGGSGSGAQGCSGRAGGGGGGAAGVGGAAGSSVGGNGGPGVISTISGVALMYGGGGAGEGESVNGTPADGAGAAGNANPATVGQDGLPNRGGGGGASGGKCCVEGGVMSGSGGSGVVIISYTTSTVTPVLNVSPIVFF